MKGRLKTIICSAAAVIFSVNTSATVNCGPSRIISLQVQTNSILVLAEGQDWHKVGAIGGPGVAEMLSALLAAQMAGKRVVIRYPAGYDCSAYELSTPAMMVRVATD